MAVLNMFLIIFQIIVIYSHFHIFAWKVNDGCFEGIGHFLICITEGTPFALGWMFIAMSIGHFGFGVYPIVSFCIGIVPYYWFIHWLVNIGAFYPDNGRI